MWSFRPRDFRIDFIEWKLLCFHLDFKDGISESPVDKKYFFLIR